ncbi:MAG TPA: hypothetical protein VNT55_14395 [Baekduia sp.]|nr:hypothetical protein [Baekduia sp.]
MVRGPAAVLALLAAQAYVLLAPELPVIGDVDTSILVASAVGSAFVFLCIACAAPVSDVPPLLVLLAAGAFGLVAGLNVADVGAGATPVEAIAYSAFGGLFAVGLLAPSLAVALPVFVAAIDIVSTYAGGPSEVLANAGQTQPGDPLSLELPDWGNGLPAGRLGISDAVFAGVFLVFARRFGLRMWWTAFAMWVATVGAIALKVGFDRAVPVLPLLAAAYFVANADRLPALLRAASRG